MRLLDRARCAVGLHRWNYLDDKRERTCAECGREEVWNPLVHGYWRKNDLRDLRVAVRADHEARRLTGEYARDRNHREG